MDINTVKQLMDNSKQDEATQTAKVDQLKTQIIQDRGLLTQEQNTLIAMTAFSASLEEIYQQLG